MMEELYHVYDIACNRNNCRKMVKLKMVKAKKTMKVNASKSESLGQARGRKVQFSDKDQVKNV